MNKKLLGLYIHIPFCDKKCLYCDFYSVNNNQELQDKYVNKIIQELQNWNQKIDKTINTIYFGGGTPSLLKPDKIYKVLNFITQNFSILNNNLEVTIEVNPADYSYSDFQILKNMGINRVSVGAQSLDDQELQILGRRHNTKQILNTYYNIIKSGINNISFDFIIGLYTQNFEKLNNIINFCKNNKISHISTYLLKVEPNTQFFYNKNIKNFSDSDICSDFYLHISENLKNIGYNHYEISNFALENKQSKHNLKYWNLDEYLGVGPSAHSFLDKKRFYYENNLYNFISNPKIVYENNKNIMCDTPEEYIMLKLRLSDGINIQDFENKFGKNILNKYINKFKKYQNFGLINFDENKISLNTNGFLLSNTIISDVIL